MLKEIKQKAKFKDVTGNFKELGRSSNFKNTSIQLSTEEILMQSLDKFNKLAKTPNKGQQVHIVTKNAVNSFDFILAILANEKIKKLHIAFYRIGKKVVNELSKLIESGHIGAVHLLINDGFPKLVPECWNLIKSMEGDRFIVRVENNHTKIILVETTQNRYIIEGSGNLSINARIEQYTFMNNDKVYNFHRNWIEAI